MISKINRNYQDNTFVPDILNVKALIIGCRRLIRQVNNFQ